MTGILVLLFVIILNGFFAASELSIVSARKARLKQLADDKGPLQRGAIAALELGEDAGKFLASVQIGITLISTFAGAYGGATLAKPVAAWLVTLGVTPETADSVGFGVVIALITYVSLLIGELIPKRLGVQRAEAIAVRVARPMQLFAKVGAPFVWIMQKSSDTLMRLLRLDFTETSGVTEEEVKTMIAEGTESGVFEVAERAMLEGVLRLGDRTARALMTPRTELVWLDADADTESQLAKLAATTGYSRLPLAHGELDEIIGVVHAKDVLAASLAGTPIDLIALARPTLTVLDHTPVLKLLEQFRSTRQHMAIVVDEHGSVEGLATATDLLEAVMGDLPDFAGEDDMSIVTRADGSLLIDAMKPVDEIAAAFSARGFRATLRHSNDDFHTLAGFVLKQLGHLPTAGESFTFEGATFEVLDMDGRRVDKVLVTLPAIEAAETTEKVDA